MWGVWKGIFNQPAKIAKFLTITITKQIMNKIKLTEQQIAKIKYLTEKMREPKHFRLYSKIAEQIGINLLEKAIGLTLEDNNIKKKGAYMTAICKSYGFQSNKHI